MHSQGLPNVTRAVINIKEKDDERGKKGQKELIVEGTGFKRVMTTMGVVGEQTISNHVTEVEQVLGIEAARRTIINEIQFTMSGHGIYVDPRHCMLLGDVMTYKVRYSTPEAPPHPLELHLTYLNRAKSSASLDSASQR